MTQDYYQQGLTKAKAGDDRGAIADFELALIATPEWAEIYYRRRGGETPQAEEYQARFADVDLGRASAASPRL